MITQKDRAALIKDGEVIGDVYFPPKKGRYIKVATQLTKDRTPAKIEEFKISRSKVNCEKAFSKELIVKLTNESDVYVSYNLKSL